MKNGIKALQEASGFIRSLLGESLGYSEPWIACSSVCTLAELFPGQQAEMGVWLGKVRQLAQMKNGRLTDLGPH